MHINEQFWNLTENEKQSFVFHHVSQHATKRTTTGEGTISRRSCTLQYTLKDADGTLQEVCEVFFF